MSLKGGGGRLSIIIRIQGSHSHRKSWNLKPFWKSHGFLSFFSRDHGKLIFQFKVKVIENSGIFAQTISSVHDIWLWQSSSLHLQVHYFLSYAVSYMYYTVCVAMVVSEGRPSLFFKEVLIYG